MRSYFTIFLALLCASSVRSFTIPHASVTTFRSCALDMAPKDPSRSGTKRERMDKLAEMEALGSANSDNSVFVKAAGGFVAFIVIAIAAAASSGLLTQY